MFIGFVRNFIFYDLEQAETFGVPHLIFAWDSGTEFFKTPKTATVKVKTGRI
jgi:hypothetical protein